MANIRKRGNTYQITVSSGYDIKGKQIRESVSFTPDQSKTPKHQQKELEKFAYDFEQKVKSGLYLDGEKITLEEYAHNWIETYAKKLQLIKPMIGSMILERFIILMNTPRAGTYLLNSRCFSISPYLEAFAGGN